MLVAKKYLLGALLALSATTVLADEKLDLARAGEIVSRRCSLCHGLQGESASPVFPRLAGQHAEYIAKQLTEFKSGHDIGTIIKTFHEAAGRGFDASGNEGARGIFRGQEGGRASGAGCGTDGRRQVCL